MSSSLLTAIHLHELLRDLGYVATIGMELEFYILGDKVAISDFLEECRTQNIAVEREKGWQQFEVQTPPCKDIKQAVEALHILQALIKQIAISCDCTANFSAKPFAEDYGSALHLHASLHNRTGLNLYSTGEIESNTLLMYSIGGLLLLIPESLHVICQEDVDYSRFSERYLAPTHVSWGGNNRTTCLRIPRSAPHLRRIEYRIAPSSADVATVISAMLAGIYYGITHKIEPIVQTWGNAADEQYQLAPLPKTAKEAAALYHKSGILASLLKT